MLDLSCCSFGDSESRTNFVLEVVESSKSKFCLLIIELDFESLGVFKNIKERLIDVLKYCAF